MVKFKKKKPQKSNKTIHETWHETFVLYNTQREYMKQDHLNNNRVRNKNNKHGKHVSKM